MLPREEAMDEVLTVLMLDIVWSNEEKLQDGELFNWFYEDTPQVDNRLAKRQRRVDDN